MNKKYVIFSFLIFVLLLAVSSVSAESNPTDAVITDDASSVDSLQDEDVNLANDNVAFENEISDNEANLDLEQVEMDDVDDVDDADEEISSKQKNTLGTCYFYEANQNKLYLDNMIVTKNLVKYYGDSQKFPVKIVDEKNNPDKNIPVYFGKTSAKAPVKKITNSKGMAYFNVKYPVGTHKVISLVRAYKKNKLTKSFWFAQNKVTVKSTIPTKSLKKSIKEKNKAFSIKFLTSKGKLLANKKVKIIVNGKTHVVKTNSKGIAKIKINSLKVGKHTIKAKNPSSKETRKITVKITK